MVSGMQVANRTRPHTKRRMAGNDDDTESAIHDPPDDGFDGIDGDEDRLSHPVGSPEAEEWFVSLCESIRSNNASCCYLDRHGLVFDDDKIRRFVEAARGNDSLVVLVKMELRYLTETGFQCLADWINGHLHSNNNTGPENKDGTSSDGNDNDVDGNQSDDDNDDNHDHNDNDSKPKLAMLVLQFTGQSTTFLPFFLSRLVPEMVRVKNFSLDFDFGSICRHQDEANRLAAFCARNTSIETLELEDTGETDSTTTEANDATGIDAEESPQGTPRLLTAFLNGLSNNSTIREVVLTVDQSQDNDGWIEALSTLSVPNVQTIRLRGNLPSGIFKTFLKPWRNVQQCCMDQLVLDDMKLQRLMQFLREHPDFQALELTRFTDGTFDDVLALLAVTETHPSLHRLSIHFQGNPDTFGALDGDRAAALGSSLVQNTTLRHFSFRVGGCTNDGASVLARHIAKIEKLEALLLYGPITVDQARTIIQDGIQHNLSLLQVRDLGTDEDWEETMNRVKLNEQLYKITCRNQRIQQYLTPLLTHPDDGTAIPDALFPHIVYKLASNYWYDLLYLACRERILVR